MESLVSLVKGASHGLGEVLEPFSCKYIIIIVRTIDKNRKSCFKKCYCTDLCLPGRGHCKRGRHVDIYI